METCCCLSNMRLHLLLALGGPCTYAAARSVNNSLAAPRVAPDVYSDVYSDVYYYSSRLSLTKAMDFLDAPPSKSPTWSGEGLG